MSTPSKSSSAKPVTVNESDLKLYSAYNVELPPVVGSLIYNSGTNTATWTFPDLGTGKYAIVLDNAITDIQGHAIDAKWDTAHDESDVLVDHNDEGPDWPQGISPGKAFFPIPRDPGNTDPFRLHFSLVNGDYDGNGLNNNRRTRFIGISCTTIRVTQIILTAMATVTE